MRNFLIVVMLVAVASVVATLIDREKDVDTITEGTDEDGFKDYLGV